MRQRQADRHRALLLRRLPGGGPGPCAPDRGTRPEAAAAFPRADRVCARGVLRGGHPGAPARLLGQPGLRRGRLRRGVAPPYGAPRRFGAAGRAVEAWHRRPPPLDYSTLGSGPMMATARTFLRQGAATRHLFDEQGCLLRSPTPAEVRAFRREVLALPADDPMRRLCEEARDFATTAGVLDLFFHPLECTFTLAELGEMLQAVGLEPLGVLCHNPHQDRENRRRYKDIGPSTASGPGMPDLPRWHAVEAAFPEAFGRMHTVFAQRPLAVAA
mmetsp:Transcript_133100/g.413857  ORF Transcript_133100/g.413857 Transcript_133100/m.413857 type:complete len:272 (-) Transcript_133100:37-852(-)